MKADSKIYVAGHNGLAGSAMLRNLNELGFKNIITKNHDELDLIDIEATSNFLKLKNQNMYFWPQQKLEEFMQIIHTLQTTFFKIFLFKQT